MGDDVETETTIEISGSKYLVVKILGYVFYFGYGKFENETEGEKQ